jgi:hypothetical protein
MPVAWIDARRNNARRSGYYIVIDGTPMVGPFPTYEARASERDGVLS